MYVWHFCLSDNWNSPSHFTWNNNNNNLPDKREMQMVCNLHFPTGTNSELRIWNRSVEPWPPAHPGFITSKESHILLVRRMILDVSNTEKQEDPSMVITAHLNPKYYMYEEHFYDKKNICPLGQDRATTCDISLCPPNQFNYETSQVIALQFCIFLLLFSVGK